MRARVLQGPLNEIQKVWLAPETETTAESVSVQVSASGEGGLADNCAKEQQEKNSRRQVNRIMAYNVYCQSYAPTAIRFYGKTVKMSTMK